MSSEEGSAESPPSIQSIADEVIQEESMLSEFAAAAAERHKSYPHFQSLGWTHPWGSYEPHPQDNINECSPHQGATSTGSSSRQCKKAASSHSLDGIGYGSDEIDSLAIFQGPATDPEEVYKNFPNWETLLRDENHEGWKLRCDSLFSNSFLEHALISPDSSYKSKLRAYLGSWNSHLNHCSPYIYLKDDFLTAHRIPRPRHTDAIRGKLGFNRGIHCWEIRITGGLGSHCCVGIGTRKGSLTMPGYVALIGYDSNSFGWDLISGKLYHKRVSYGVFPFEDEQHFGTRYQEGERIKMILDCESRSLSFYLEDEFLGIALTDLPRFTFFPTVSMVYGNSEASLVYLGPPAL